MCEYLIKHKYGGSYSNPPNVEDSLNEVYVLAHIFAGVDLGVTSKHKATVVNEFGKKIKPLISFGTTRKEFDYFLNQCLSDQSQGTIVKAIFEPTNMAWFPFAQYLVSRGQQVFRVKSEKVSDLRKYYRKHTKTDAIDSETLAKMPLVDEDSLYELYLPDAKTLALDRKCKQREKITVSIAARKTRIRTIFTSFACPQLIACFKNPYDERARAFYGKYTNPFKVKKLGLKRLRLFLDKASSAKMEDLLAENIFAACLDAVEIYGAGNYLDFDELQEEVNIELRLLAAEEAEVSLLDKQIEKLYKELHPSNNLQSIPGIGPALAPVFLASIGDPKRFENQRQFKCFTGLIPGKNESGSSDKKGVKITKAGRRSLKRALYLAADKARQYDPELARFYYEQMVNKGSCHIKAVCAVATKLAPRILRVLRNNQPYELRDLHGQAITMAQGRMIIKESLKVPETIRKRKRNKKLANKPKEHVKYSRQSQLGCSKVT